MSGSDSITSAITAAMTTAVTSLLTIPSTSLPWLRRRAPGLLRRGFLLPGFVRRAPGRVGEDFRYGPHRVRQGFLDRLGQAHPGADVGGFAGHQQAAPGL